MPNLIIGVDPGKVTGVATYVPTAEWRLSGAWEVPNEEFQIWLYAHLRGMSDVGQTALVVCERFVISGGTLRVSRGDENWSIETIGVCRFLCRLFGHTLELQSAGDAKKLAPDSRLRSIGWHVRGKGHANDAVRHVVLAAASRLNEPPPWV